MGSNKVRSVTSNQWGIYKNLEQVVCKYATCSYLRPMAKHTLESFANANRFVCNFYNNINTPSLKKQVVIDSGCGTGESTLHLAKKFPNAVVIGIDKSKARLDKAGNLNMLKSFATPDFQNVFWVRGELLDFWRLALEQVKQGSWEVIYHAIYYPNPWPKESEAKRRFHLHPIFPTLLQLSRVTELRTNWEVYAKEFEIASRTYFDLTKKDFAKIKCEPFEPIYAQTAFERKYKEAHQQLWRATIDLNSFFNPA